MASLPFATAQQAADIAEIEVSEIGVNAHDFPTKKNLTDTGEFDAGSLSSYADQDFVLLNDIQDGTKYVSVSANVQSGREEYATVKVGSGSAGSTSQATVEEGSMVQFTCTLLDEESASFDGWYNGGSRVSTSLTYSMAASDGLSLEARINYLSVSPASMSFAATGGSQTLTIETNESWTIE